MNDERFLEAAEATWPAHSLQRVNGWIIRDGDGGGKRVSAATAERRGDVPEIEIAEREMERLGQGLLFMIREGEGALDRALAARGYDVIDPVTIYAGETRLLSAPPVPRLSAFPVYPPLGVMAALWNDAGIGPARLRVMARAQVEKTTILGRTSGQVAGAAFVGVHENIGVLHALEVVPALRRRNTAVNIMRKAAEWTQDRGGNMLCVLVTKENTGANALYSSLNMKPVGYYHYRYKTVQ